MTIYSDATRRTSLVAGNMPGVLRNAERGRIYESIGRQIEDRVEKMIAARHDYPMWPERDIDYSPMDAFEKQYHGEIRATFYQETIFLIRILKELREVYEH